MGTKKLFLDKFEDTSYIDDIWTIYGIIGRYLFNLNIISNDYAYISDHNRHGVEKDARILSIAWNHYDNIETWLQ